MATKKMQKKMHKKNRRQQRTKRVGGGLTSFLRKCSSDPYIVKFVEEYKQAGLSTDKPKHVDRFIDEDAPQLMEYFRKINEGVEPCENEKGAVIIVRDLFSKKEEFHANYGTPVSSNFSKVFMDLATVVNPDSFKSTNPMAKDAYFSKVNPMIAPKVPIEPIASIEPTGTRSIARNPLIIPTRGDKIPAAQTELDEMPIASSNSIDEMPIVPTVTRSLTRKPLNIPKRDIMEDSQDQAAANLKEMEAKRSEGGSKKSRRRRNQRRNRSRKQ